MSTKHDPECSKDGCELICSKTVARLTQELSEAYELIALGCELMNRDYPQERDRLADWLTTYDRTHGGKP